MPCSARSTSSVTPAIWPTSSDALTKASMGKTVADVALRVWIPQAATAEVRQADVAHGARPDRQADRGQSADGRLPDRLVGNRGTASTTLSVEVPRRHRSARRSARPG